MEKKYQVYTCAQMEAYNAWKWKGWCELYRDPMSEEPPGPADILCDFEEVSNDSHDLDEEVEAEIAAYFRKKRPRLITMQSEHSEAEYNQLKRHHQSTEKVQDLAVPQCQAGVRHCSSTGAGNVRTRSSGGQKVLQARRKKKKVKPKTPVPPPPPETLQRAEELDSGQAANKEAEGAPADK